MKYELRPMDVGEILDRSAKIYLENFSLLFSIALVVTIPMMILTGLLIGGLGLANFDPSSQQTMNPAEAVQNLTTIVILVLFLVLAATLLNTLTQGALFQALSDLYLGRPASMGSAFSRAFSRLLSLMGATFLVGIILFLGIFPGCFLACTPFFFFYAALGVTIPVVMLEGRGVFDALSRSWDLTRGHRWRVLGALLTVIAVITLWSWIVQFALQLSGLNYLFQNVLAQLAGAAVQPFAAVVTILLYYDLRVRKEAFDLQVMAREVGGAGAPA